MTAATRTQSLRPLPLLALAALSVAACAERRSAATAEHEAEDWGAEVELRIGSVDDPETSLSSVGAVLAADDGRLYVAQPQDGNVLILGGGGERLGQFGRRGEGPGEFSQLAPSSLGWWGGGQDTLWVSDSQLRRVSLFLADGTFAGALPLTNPPHRDVLRVSVQTVLPDGTAMGMPTFACRLIADGGLGALPVLRFALEGGPAWPVVEVPVGNRQLVLVFGQGGTYCSSQPYADSPLTGLSGAAERVVVVERPAASDAGSARYRVTALNPGGDTIWSRLYAYQPLPIPRAETDSVRAALIERSVELVARMGASRSDLEREVQAKLHLPAFRPPFAAVQVEGDGSIWLQRMSVPGESGSRWLRLDPDGEPSARLRLPDGLRLLHVAAGQAWAVETDALGVPYLVRLRLGRADPS